MRSSPEGGMKSASDIPGLMRLCDHEMSLMQGVTPCGDAMWRDGLALASEARGVTDGVRRLSPGV